MFFQKNRLNAQVIKTKSDKYKKRTLREAKRKIKKGEIVDSHSFAMFLNTIDSNYSHIKTDIKNSTRVADYASVRAKKMAETRQLLEFFPQDKAELDRAYQMMVARAEKAERMQDLKRESIAAIDIDILKSNFDKLDRRDS